MIEKKIQDENEDRFAIMDECSDQEVEAKECSGE